MQNDKYINAFTCGLTSAPEPSGCCGAKVPVNIGPVNELTAASKYTTQQGREREK